MKTDSTGIRTTARVAALCLVGLALGTGPGLADEWLVWIGGGITPIDGGWSERRDQVLYTRLDGTLLSVPFFEVDLPASTFITWQLNGRRRLPPRQELPADPPVGDGTVTPCVEATVVALPGSETLVVATGGETETVHLACLDTPETNHKFPSLGWFGRTALDAVSSEVRPGDPVCLTDETPPLRDPEGHRVVYVTLADGRDYTAETIAGGLGLLRPGTCSRAAGYRALEDRAIAERRGLWGAGAAQAAFTAANNAAAAAAGGAPPPRSAGGG